LLGKARARGVIEIETIDIRAFAVGPHAMTDDAPFGGGAGMVMKPEPIVAAIESVAGARVILLSPGGRPFSQAVARELAGERHVVLVCGRYEGVDDRVRAQFVHDELSIGDYVLSGGEAAAWVVVEAVARLVPGVVGNAESIEAESFAEGLLEYPQYTRPRVFRGHEVPEVLLSGDHAAIESWRREAQIARTKAARADLYERWLATGDSTPNRKR
jgi:tRNA (guanine37-N1)-methyltransferase